MQQRDNTLPTFEYFRLEPVTEGVYAAIGVEGGAAHCNAGIIDLGDHTLIFDTFMTPRAGEDLRAAAEHLTRRPASYVANSHVHSDHWLGNQVFAPGATIISTHKNHELMAREVADFINQHKADPTPLEEQIQAMEERLRTESDERWRASLQASVEQLGHIVAALPGLTLCFPNQTFEGKLVFHGAHRRAELLSYDGGHTPSDVLLVLPEERIAFTGDLAFFECHPFLSSGDLGTWCEVLEKVEGADIETFVPGHGPVGTKADIGLMRRYITTLEELAAQVVEDGESIDKALRQPLTPPFDGWSKGLLRFETNMRFLKQRLSDQEDRG